VSERSPSVCASSRVASGSCVCTYFTSAEECGRGDPSLANAPL
jgi:hypothetical protein